ncbi:MAG: GNAT family N-acetyltransferase [Ruminococcaceae bacterium]|nr:GNAT family N-acetyltransferase [Oscillospiraceae bacterium]
MYSICKIRIWNIASLLKVSRILHKCGKDMAAKYNLHHWDNSHLKNWIIVALCVLRNNVYLVYDNKTPVATFQTRKIDKSFLFMKLATSPDYAGRGVGTFCLNEIERLGKSDDCREIICEVYDKSERAIKFYLSRGYTVYGTTDTLKYKELKLKKEI